MKKWIAKAIVQKTISFLPYGHSINELFQKWVTKGIYLTDEYFTDRLEHAKNHLHFYQKIKGKKVPGSFLEIGTGWYPVVPISMFLAGTEKNYSLDIAPLTNKERLSTTLKKFIAYHEKGILKKYFNYSTERLEMLRKLTGPGKNSSFEQLSGALQTEFKVCDARKISFIPDHQIELITSNNTFEHIYPDVLIGILKEFKRILKKEEVMSHFIDMSDHFAHFDKSITIYNFLKFSDGEWKLIDNSIQPQNRLRLPDFRKIYNELKIPITIESLRDGNMVQLQSLKLSEKFKSIPMDELAVSHCYLVSQI